jgi:hypothetical protein
MGLLFTYPYTNTIFVNMEIYISIDGVIRNLIQKFDYHYVDHYLNSDEIGEKLDVDTGEVIKIENEEFEYGINEPVQNDNILNSYKFRSKEEFEYFLFLEFPIEIFGHAGLSYSTAITDLNKLISSNLEHNITLIGMDEFGKAKPATLFFLSKNGIMANNIKFIKSTEIEDAWKNCDYWITDNKKVIDACPAGKFVNKFNTKYNEFFTIEKEITKLKEIKETWINFSENSTTLISTKSLTNAKPQE